jgi:hypothetical protein
MGLSDEEKQFMESRLDKCDEALADKPTLASIFDADWRREFRQKALSDEKIGYPTAYAAPVFGDSLPSDYQSRLEEGATVLLSKLCDADRNGLTSRLRGAGCVSAEEELLLARSFALEFGTDALVGPQGDISQTRPEFTVVAGGREIAIEAKGLLDSENIRLHWQAAQFVGNNFWVSPLDTLDQDLKRVENAIKKKTQQISGAGSGIVVFTQYTAWPPANMTANLIRKMALDPGAHGINEPHTVLAVTYVGYRFIQGVWFNPHAARRCCIESALRERLRRALKDSFYPRPDGVFFDELMDDTTHESMLEKMERHS